MPHDASNTSQNQKIEFLPCRFKFHNFTAEVGEVRIQCQVMRMDSSIYLYVGESNNGCMDDLSMAVCWLHGKANQKKEQNAISTKLMGSFVDETSSNIARRLSRKTGETVYVSFNVQVNNISLPGIEKRIHEEFKNHPELLSPMTD